jgi:hypothetical protein
LKNFFDELFNTFLNDNENLFHRKKTPKNEFNDLFELIGTLLNNIFDDYNENTTGKTKKKKEKPYWHWADSNDQYNYHRKKTTEESFYQYEDFGYNRDWEDSFQSTFNSGYSKMYTGKIPYDSKIASYYAILEIPYGSSLAAVKSSWKTMCKKYHPDYFSNEPEKQKTGNIIIVKSTEAYKEIEKFLKLYGEI